MRASAQCDVLCSRAWQIDALLGAFQASIQALAGKEPDVWQLRIVECIYDALSASVAARNDENDAPEANIVAQGDTLTGGKDRESEALEQATLTVCKAIHRAAAQLCGAVDQALSSPTVSDDEGQDGERNDREHFMARFWGEMGSISAAVVTNVRVDEEDAAEDASNVEILTFDDEYQEDAQSVNRYQNAHVRVLYCLALKPCWLPLLSTPTADGIPSLIKRMQGADEVDRAMALDEFTQVYCRSDLAR